MQDIRSGSAEPRGAPEAWVCRRNESSSPGKPRRTFRFQSAFLTTRPGEVRERAVRTAFQGFHESRLTAFMAVRLAVGANETHHQKPSSGPPRPPTSHGFSSHHFPAKNIAPEPVSARRQPFSVGLRRELFSATHVALQAHWAVATAKGTHGRKRGTFSVAQTGERFRLR